MTKRGRKSTAELSVVPISEAVKRAEPPAELTAEQANEWRAVVDHMPFDWFRPETYPLLAQYCRHVTRARRISRLLEAMEAEPEVDVKAYRDLLRSEDEQSASLARLATKMRLAQQSRYDAAAAARRHKEGPRERAPWE